MLLGITPARGGSKGIPGKNIRKIAGRPLISFTIEVALATPEIDRYIVSTDSQEIANVSRQFGADVPFLRPDELATDFTPTLPVLKHAVLECENIYQESVDTVVLLDPTAPLRKVEDVTGCIKYYNEVECDSVISVNHAAKNPYFNMLQIRDGYCDLVISSNPPIVRRQDAPEVFEMNTVVAVFSRRAIIQADQRIPPKTKPFIIPRNRSIDIDTPEDLLLLEYILNNN
jgi:CMP-N-acetylneuraminic acid synthetase